MRPSARTRLTLHEASRLLLGDERLKSDSPEAKRVAQLLRDAAKRREVIIAGQPKCVDRNALCKWVDEHAPPETRRAWSLRLGIPFRDHPPPLVGKARITDSIEGSHVTPAEQNLRQHYDRAMKENADLRAERETEKRSN